VISGGHPPREHAFFFSLPFFAEADDPTGLRIFLLVRWFMNFGSSDALCFWEQSLGRHFAWVSHGCDPPRRVIRSPAATTTCLRSR
jgi:hypothetical protein